LLPFKQCVLAIFLKAVSHPLLDVSPFSQKGGARLSLRVMLKVCRLLSDNIVCHHSLARPDIDKRRRFILKLAKALLSYGAPSHRIESQLVSASEILDTQAAFVHIPNIIIVSFGNGGTRTMRTHFVRAGGRIALTSLHKVHLIYRAVLHDEMGAEAGTEALKDILHAPPIYPLTVRCFLAFICASIICVLAFGGSVVDMGVSGLCACVLQYLGLNAAAKSSMYANVYEYVVPFLLDCYSSSGALIGFLFPSLYPL
jgi:uncharacterized membrane protein YjjP (DUF1212 family)